MSGLGWDADCLADGPWGGGAADAQRGLYVKSASEACAGQGAFCAGPHHRRRSDRKPATVLPDNLVLGLIFDSWVTARCFSMVADVGSMSQPKLLKTFNAGVG